MAIFREFCIYQTVAVSESDVPMLAGADMIYIQSPPTLSLSNSSSPFAFINVRHALEVHVKWNNIDPALGSQ